MIILPTIHKQTMKQIGFKIRYSNLEDLKDQLIVFDSFAPTKLKWIRLPWKQLWPQNWLTSSDPVANKMIPTLNSISFISNSITLRERTLMMGLGFQLKMWVGKINKKKAERIEGSDLEWGIS